MIRTIDMHKCNSDNKNVIIYATNDIDQVACLADNYEVMIDGKSHSFNFQKNNGLNIEILIAICLDRLYCLQETQYSSVDNELAIVNLENTLHWLGSRTDVRKSYNLYNKEN